MLLDRKRIRKWQKWIYGLMAILMVLFLVVLIPGAGLKGCSSGPSQSSSANDQIKVLQKQLQASPGNLTTLSNLGDLYIGAAGGQTQGSAKATQDLKTAAGYLERYDATLAKRSDLQSTAARITNLQKLTQVYSQLSDYPNATSAWGRLVELQPTVADNFVFYGIAASSAGDTKTALLAFGRYLTLEPKGQYASEVKGRIKELLKPPTTAPPTSPPTASPSPSGSANPTASPSP